MFKFLIIFFLVIYIISKIGGFIVRTLFSGFVSQEKAHQGQGGRNQSRRPSDGNVNIDFNPKTRSKLKDGGDFKGGDYVKYEEVD